MMHTDLTRRTLLTGAAAGLVTALGASSGPASARSAAAIRVRALQTGTVSVKNAHRRLVGPARMRFATILADRTWTGPLPIRAWLIDHPEGRILVDTGESSRTDEPGWFDDPFTPRLLRLDVDARDELRASLAPDRLVLTHLHSDHTGGLRAFGDVEAFVGRADLDRPPPGSVRSKWPAGWDPTPVDFTHGPVGPFGASQRITADGRVRLVPTPGHTAGHLSVVVDRGDDLVMLAGDASFTAGQVRRRDVAGIVTDVAAARRTLAAIAALAEERPLVYLPTHDPASGRRLARGEHL